MTARQVVGLGSVVGSVPSARRKVSTPAHLRAPFVHSEAAGESWRADAACADPRVDPEVFFAVGVSPEAAEETAAAKQVCRLLCPVRFQCLAWALESGQAWGVAGGLDEVERKAAKRRLARARSKAASSGDVS